MQPIRVSIQLATADDDGVAQNQTPGAAGNLTLNGALVSGGVATLTSAGAARQVLVTTASNETAKTLTIYGTDANGVAISETITGPNATTGTTTAYFRTVTQVAVSAAFAGNVKVGTNGVGATRAIFFDQFAAAIGLQVDVAGTANFTVQQTMDNLQTVAADDVVWFNHPDIALAAATADAQGNYAYPPLYARLQINSGTDRVSLTAVQQLY